MSETTYNGGCTFLCPKCCIETADEIAAKSEAKLAGRSMTLSNSVAIIVLLAHIWFQAHNQTLVLPNEIYALILGPYGGKVLAKLADKVKAGSIKRKRKKAASRAVEIAEVETIEDERSDQESDGIESGAGSSRG